MTMLQKMHHRCRGFNLVEMMVALGLMGIFLLLAGQVFVFTVNTFHQTGRHLNNMATSEAAFTQLRQDVWTARHVKVIHNRTVLCRYGPTSSPHWIKWTLGTNGQMRRLTSSGQNNDWPRQGRRQPVRGKFKLMPGALELQLFWKNGHRLRVFPREYVLLARHNHAEVR